MPSHLYPPLIADSVARLQEGLREDPRRVVFQGSEGPKEFLFSQRVVDWIYRLQKEPSPALLLAAWGHVFKRWAIPRDTYPKTTSGYHQWRRAQAQMSADEAGRIAAEAGVSEDMIKTAKDVMLKKNFPSDPDTQTFEDADCLAFLEMKLMDYLEEWERDQKIARILQGTLEKMSPKAKELAMTIDYAPAALRLLEEAIRTL